MSVASDELAERIGALIGHKPGITEMNMFGGRCYMLNGNMICGSMSSGALLMRVGPELHGEAVKRPGAHAMHQGGRDMIGFVEVTDDIEDDDNLLAWIDYAWGFVKTLPPKAAKKKPRTAPKTTANPKATAKAPARKKT